MADGQLWESRVWESFIPGQDDRIRLVLRRNQGLTKLKRGTLRWVSTSLDHNKSKQNKQGSTNPLRVSKNKDIRTVKKPIIIKPTYTGQITQSGNRIKMLITRTHRVKSNK